MPVPYSNSLPNIKVTSLLFLTHFFQHFFTAPCISICLTKTAEVWWYIGCWILHVCVSICAGSSERASEWILITFARHELKWRSEWDTLHSALTAQEPDAPLNAREAFSFVSNSSHVNTSSALQLYRALNDSTPMSLQRKWVLECSRCFQNHTCVVDGWWNPVRTLQY